MRYKHGFTYLEVLLVITLSAPLLISIFEMIYSGMAARAKANRLELAVSLARSKMMEIESKARIRTGGDSGEFQDHPGYRYETEIVEEEINLLESAKEDEQPNNPLLALLKERGKILETKTGGIIKLLHIYVRVYYKEKDGEKKYQLEFYRHPFL